MQLGKLSKIVWKSCNLLLCQRLRICVLCQEAGQRHFDGVKLLRETSLCWQSLCLTCQKEHNSTYITDETLIN
uniref:LIM zinc-binding domain-containing protein n=1 Tax=Globodera pallida TaxID=36090 RepID=A0A183BQT9_GLOPA